MHKRRREFKDFIVRFDHYAKPHIPEEQRQAAEVACLSPSIGAFDELGLDPLDFSFPITAYGDGCSMTGIRGSRYEIEAVCLNEDYEE
jgi:hypothetical protein